MFTAVNTSALNVESVFVTIKNYQHTDEFIQQRNRLNVLFVANDSLPLEALLDTVEFTLERSRTNATCVTRRFVILKIFTLTCTDT